MRVIMEHIHKAFKDKEIFTDFNLNVDEGEILCIMGESGRGKTTLFSLIMGLEQPDFGRIICDSNAISAVFQEDRLFEGLSPIKNIKLGCDYKITSEEILEHLKQILPQDCALKPVKNLSGGMKRRVAILRAILADSKIIIMDEPFQGLDDETKYRVIEYIKKYRKNRILLYSTHDTVEYEQLGGKLLVL